MAQKYLSKDQSSESYPKHYFPLHSWRPRYSVIQGSCFSHVVHQRTWAEKGNIYRTQSFADGEKWHSIGQWGAYLRTHLEVFCGHVHLCKCKLYFTAFFLFLLRLIAHLRQIVLNHISFLWAASLPGLQLLIISVWRTKTALTWRRAQLRTSISVCVTAALFLTSVEEFIEVGGSPREPVNSKFMGASVSLSRIDIEGSQRSNRYGKKGLRQFKSRGCRVSRRTQEDCFWTPHNLRI